MVHWLCHHHWIVPFTVGIVHWLHYHHQILLFTSEMVHWLCFHHQIVPFIAGMVHWLCLHHQIVPFIARMVHWLYLHHRIVPFIARMVHQLCLYHQIVPFIAGMVHWLCCHHWIVPFITRIVHWICLIWPWSTPLSESAAQDPHHLCCQPPLFFTSLPLICGSGSVSSSNFIFHSNLFIKISFLSPPPLSSTTSGMDIYECISGLYSCMLGRGARVTFHLSSILWFNSNLISFATLANQHWYLSFI